MSDQATKKLWEPRSIELMLMRQNKIEMIYLCGCVSHWFIRMGFAPAGKTAPPFDLKFS